MNDNTILIITDHIDLASAWGPSLIQRGIKVNVVHYEDFCAWRSLKRYEVIILDTYAGECDFVGLCRTLRNHFRKVILLLTYDRDERIHLQFYQAGIDDTLVKPLSVPLFLAKVNVWIKRATRRFPMKHQLRVGHFRFDPGARRLVTEDGSSKQLSALESRLLTLLMSNAGLILETNLLIDRVWPNENIGDRELLKSLVYRLRRKVEPDSAMPRYIQTVTGHGYVFRTE